MEREEEHSYVFHKTWKRNDKSALQLANKAPKVVMDYKKGMVAIDLSDQFGAYTNPLGKSLKWFRKVEFEIILTMYIFNKYIIHFIGNRKHDIRNRFQKKCCQAPNKSRGN